MKHYYKHQDQVKERVANNAQKKREMTMIERLCEIQQEKAHEEEEITEFMVNELARMELKLLCITYRKYYFTKENNIFSYIA